MTMFTSIIGRSLIKTLTVGLLRGFYQIEKRLTSDIAPFASVFVIVVCLLAIVFCKMEIRRMGYSILQLSRVERQIRDQERLQMVQLAKITRPEHVRAVAENRLTLRKAGSGQIIQMTEQGVVFRE